jgi:hypothetical protein
MNEMKRLLYLILVFSTAVVLLASCKKYLDQKPRENLAVPQTLTDLQALEDNQMINGSANRWLEFVADNYFLTTSAWNNQPKDAHDNYIWAPDAKITESGAVTWTAQYNAIYQANFVLDLLPTITTSESEKDTYNSIKGTALFSRAFMFHQIAQLFCKPYSSSSLNDPGIILRFSTNVKAPVTRSTVKETYDQIINDLKLAVELLPEKALYTTRPNKAAALGLLSRVYLSMSDYTNAEIYAGTSIAGNGALMDFNTIGSSIPSNVFANPEISYISNSYVPEVFNGAHTAIVDTSLYASYAANDLRKTIFFGSNGNGTYYWKGSYYPQIDYSVFGGIASNEMYLNRAEARARTGKLMEAMNDLNTLLRNRYKTGTFSDLIAADATDALNKILTERRKELAFRGLRWSDLRRFNLAGANITLKRIVNNTTYTLPPNDLRWVLLIPETEINLSGVQQNPR